MINEPILKSIGPKMAILSPKITEMAISQKPILPKCHLPKSILHQGGTKCSGRDDTLGVGYPEGEYT